MSEEISVKISVIIPIYNAERFLRECLDDVIHQTLKEIEIILVNDDSPNANDEIICKEYVRKDDRIIYLKNQFNSGQGFSRNRAIDIAVGKYIAFVDSDDHLFDKTALETCYNKLIGSGVDFVSFGAICVDKNDAIVLNHGTRKDIYNKQKEGFKASKTGFLKELYCYDGFLSAVVYDKIYNRNFLLNNNIRFNEEINYGEDKIFCMAVYHFATRYYIFKKDFYIYRFENFNSSSNKVSDKFINYHIKMSEIEFDFLLENNLLGTFKDLFIKKSLPDNLNTILLKIRDKETDNQDSLNMFLNHFKKSFLFNLFFANLNRGLETIDNLTLFYEKPTDTKKLIAILKRMIAKLTSLRFWQNKFTTIINKNKTKI